MAFEIEARKPKDFSEKLMSLKDQKNLCDATLIINGEKFDVHSLVLSASSTYFEKMFVDEGLKEITFENMDTKAMQSILEFCYTGTIKIKPENIKEVFSLATVLLIPSFIETCSEDLQSKLNADNCLSIWKISMQGNFENLARTSFNFAQKNFEEVSNTGAFLSLEYSDLDELLDTKTIVASREKIYFALKNWFKHDEISRSENIVTLLDRIELESLPHNLLIFEPRSFCNSIKCYEKFFKALELKNEPAFTLFSQSYTLIAVGGKRNSYSRIMEIFDLRKDEWVNIDINCNRTYFTTVFLDDCLLFIGGQENDQTVDSIDYYHLRTDRLTSCALARQLGIISTAVLYKGDLYVFYSYGQYGQNIRNFYSQSNIEKFNLSQESWTSVTPIPTSRDSMMACVLGQELYVTGGKRNNVIFSVTEAYDSISNKWRSCAPMQIKRYDHSMAAVNGFLYVVGGFNDNEHLKSAEKYDPFTDKWTFIQSIKFARFGIVATNFNEKLVIAGSDSSTMEIYDEKIDKWNPMTSLNYKRSNLSLISIPWPLAEFILSPKYN